MKTVFTLLLLAFGTMCLNAQTSEKDKKFVEDAAQGGLLEVKLGELAQARATTPEVKALGQEMIADHTKINSELLLLATRLNITVPTTLNEKSQKTYDMLAEKQGVDFEKAYSHCMVSDHKKDISEFKKEAKHADDADLRGFASAKLTVLKHHKQMAKDACKVVK